MKAKAQSVIDHLKSLENEKNRQGMKQFGIHTEQALDISMKSACWLFWWMVPNNLPNNKWKRG